jgi:hypothetical protein
MATRREMVNGGATFVDAQSVNGAFDTGVTATGNSQATAYAIKASNTIVSTTAASTGVILPQGDQGDYLMICNYGASALTVYPPVGWRLHNQAVNAGTSVGAGKVAICVQITDPTKGGGGGTNEYMISISA